MMGLDPINNLNDWPLTGMETFLEKCREHNVKEINLTGSDTDPALYLHLEKLCSFLREEIPGVILGIRTNGALLDKHFEDMRLFDKGSISVTSFDKNIYRKTMGQGSPPNLRTFMNTDCGFSKNLKINIVLCPEILHNAPQCDLAKTLLHLNFLAQEQSIIRKDPNYKLKVNIREPYGQPHIDDPMPTLGLAQTGKRLGMPYYQFGYLDVTYWDVHYVEVESVNLYANGNVSEDYPVTQGYDPTFGEVKDQTNWDKHGRHVDQWVETPKKAHKKVHLQVA